MRAETNPNSRAFAVDPLIEELECVAAPDTASTSTGLARPGKKRAPKPTFDDGTTTRLFKFPSRAYPKSSYYVTSTDIIIRIKKARKKWKLVLPKKRVVSYKTNRWFAKPRWVEIELTYTQAVKQGLVEPRTAPAAAEIESVPPMTAAVIPVDLIGDQAPRVIDSGPSSLSPQVAISASDAAVPLETADPDQPTHDRPPNQSKATGPCMLAEIPIVARLETSEAPTVASASLPRHRHGETRQGSRSTFRAGVLVSALVLLAGGSTWWFTADVVAQKRLWNQPTMVSANGDRADEMPLPASGRERARELTSELPVAVMDPAPQLSDAPNGVGILATASVRDEREPTPAPQQDREIAAAQVEIPKEPALPAVTIDVPPAAPDPVPPVPAEVSSHELRVDRPDAAPQMADKSVSRQASAAAVALCRRQTAATVQAQTIQFDYGSADVPSASRKLLDRLAVQLRSCPGVALAIAGHTDADGHMNRNQGLSVQRAEAVRRQLVVAGIEPQRLSVAGFGQIRPLAPNTTSSNKRKNRRVEFVVK